MGSILPSLHRSLHMSEIMAVRLTFFSESCYWSCHSANLGILKDVWDLLQVRKMGLDLPTSHYDLFIHLFFKDLVLCCNVPDGRHFISLQSFLHYVAFIVVMASELMMHIFCKGQRLPLTSHCLAWMQSPLQPGDGVPPADCCNLFTSSSLSSGAAQQIYYQVIQNDDPHPVLGLTCPWVVAALPWFQGEQSFHERKIFICSSSKLLLDFFRTTCLDPILFLLQFLKLLHDDGLHLGWCTLVLDLCGHT